MNNLPFKKEQNRMVNFRVYGNQENLKGNPIPYTRTTQGTKFTEKAMRYAAWKGHVVASYMDYIQGMEIIDRSEFGDVHDFLSQKPINTGKKRIHMDINCYYVNDTHADSDNVFKGIADALFVNDKYLSGSFTFEYSDTPRVDITLYI